MTDQQTALGSYGAPAASTPSPGADASMKDKATDAAQQGKQAAGEVAQTAGEHVQEVKQETVRQARDLLGEAREQLKGQAGSQHQNLVSNLRSLGTELGSMSSNAEQQGVATELVSQAHGRVNDLADWLDGREPGQILDEVKTFARRRPGMFLVGALAAGVVAGRLTRGAVAVHTDDGPSGQHRAPGTAGDTQYGDTQYGDTRYSDPLGAHTTGSVTGDQAAGYAMGGSYTQPAPGSVPPPAQGYGATSTYGDGGTDPYRTDGGVRP